MERNSTSTTNSNKEFALLIAPLEARSGARLGNPHRSVCLAAYEAHPEGVRDTALACFRDGKQNPIGLFYWRVKNGHHELEPLPGDAQSGGAAAAPGGARTPLRGQGSCFVCGQESDEALFWAGQWWCGAHEGEAA